jgi:hypothetical protein
MSNKTIPFVPSVMLINGHALNADELHAVSIALRRAFVEQSVNIENVQSVPENVSDKINRFNERRALFNLIERVDGVIPTIPLVNAGGYECGIELNSYFLNSEDVSRIRNALIWMRDNWLLDHEAIRKVTIGVIERIEGKS